MSDGHTGRLEIFELPKVVLSGWVADFVAGVAVGLELAGILCAALC